MRHASLEIIRKKFDVEIQDVTQTYSVLSLQGPKSLQTLTKSLEAITSDGKVLEGLADNHTKIIVLDKLDNSKCAVTKTSLTGTSGFEMRLAPSALPLVYDSLKTTGQDFGIRDVGYRALARLAIEAGYHSFDGALRHTDNPAEAGLLDLCNLERNFLGREKLVKSMEGPLAKRLVCVTIDE